ncbi:MAG: amidohydrolase family protein [Thermoguttaceae bacterium]|nr:amidohydrolase family protein [Thermoguttaceae bacterium]
MTAERTEKTGVSAAQTEIRTYRGRRFDSSSAVEVRVSGGKIVSVETLDDAGTDCGVGVCGADGRDGLPIIAPGLFDIQVNGAVGVELSSAGLTEDGVVAVLDKMLRDGVFRCCPTLTTNAPETMISAAATIASALKSRPDLRPTVWGIHLEGPFISTAEGAVGAHPKRFCVPYSRELFDRIQDACGGLVKLVTLSPEYEGAGEFVRFLRSRGVVVAVGHTNATCAQIDEAVSAGATLSTHLSNATRHLLPKWENYFFGQLADDRLTASLIVDGFHISPQLVRAIVRTKGLDRIVLISDQSPLSGFAPGRYKTELCELEIQPNGKVTLAGDANLLACASFPVSHCVANVASIENLTLAQVYPSATTVPARLLGAPLFSNVDAISDDATLCKNGEKTSGVQNVGAAANVDWLEVGADADFLLFRLVPATFGPLGVLDGASFRTGRFDFERIVWRGREIV